MKVKFQEWYGNIICNQLDTGLHEEVDMRMSTMKPLTAQWMIDLYNYISSKLDIIINGFHLS